MSDELRPAFHKLAYELRDYLPDIVIAGGWAPYLYHRYLHEEEDYAPIKTEDIDVVVPENLRISGERSINAVLSALGFQASPSSAESPLMTAFTGEIDGIELQLEFLTHQRGPKEDIAITVQDGLSALALRYSRILLENQIMIKVNDFFVDGKQMELEISVPTPAAFVFNKGLTFPRRKDKFKRAKDLYYIFDIISADFPIILTQIAKEINAIAHAYGASWLKTFKGNLSEYFLSSDYEGAQRVLSQKPSWAFAEMNEDQFKQYVETVFTKFIDLLQ